MKFKQVFLMSVVLFLGVFAVRVYAADPVAASAEKAKSNPLAEAMMKPRMGGGMGGGMMGGMMGPGLCPIHNTELMATMATRQMVNTTDGGVVVLTANKLIKYDANLKIVKEVEVSMNVEATEKIQNEMKEKCSVCKMMNAGAAENAAAMTPPPAEKK